MYCMITIWQPVGWMDSACFYDITLILLGVSLFYFYFDLVTIIIILEAYLAGSMENTMLPLLFLFLFYSFFTCVCVVYVGMDTMCTELGSMYEGIATVRIKRWR